MKRRLVGITVGTTVIVLLALLAPLALAVRAYDQRQCERAMQEAETQARQHAPLLIALQDVAGPQEAVRLASASRPEDFALQLSDGRWVEPSSPEVEADLPSQGIGVAPETGFRDLVIPFDHTESGVLAVRVSIPDGLWRSSAAGLWGAVAAAGLVVVVGAAAVASRLARSTVSSIRQLQRTAESLCRGDLDARAPVAGPPELTQVGRTLETLAQRVNDLMVAERERIADFSHRVRTPLMAVRLGVESMENRPETQRLAAHVDELEHTVDDAIRHARETARELVPRATCLLNVVHARSAFWRVLAEDQQREMRTRLIGSDRCAVPIPSGDLEAVVDALVGNVFAHTPEGTDLFVAAEVDEVCCKLVVEDDGPPLGALPDSARGVSGSGSTGLGLDIARRAAESTGGRLTLSLRHGGGLRVEAAFGKADCLDHR